MKTSKVLVLTLALMASILAANFIVGCSEEKSSNPITSVAPAMDNTQIPIDTTTGGRDQAQPMAVASTAWEAQVLSEAFYALSRSRNGSSSKIYQGNTMSDWPYPYQGDCCDALGTITKRMYPGCPSCRGQLGLWLGQYQQGGECKFFVNLLLYRSSYGYPGGHLVLPGGRYTYPGARSWTSAGPGWILQSASMPHTAIVVSNNGGSLTVIDANWVGGRGQHVIAKHVLSASTLNANGFHAYRPHEACDLIP